MAEQHLHKHIFNFNPKDNGGEALLLVTNFFDNGDGPEEGIYTHQELSLQSYGNSASFYLGQGFFTPENLRKLANELESAEIEAKALV